MLALLALLPPALSPVAVRRAAPAELADPKSPLFTALSDLVAECHFEPGSSRDLRVMSAATRESLVDGFAGASRRQENAIGRSSLLLATADEGSGEGDLVGACGFQVLALTPDGRGERLMSTLSAAERRQMEVRPMLSNLAVSPEWRRRGVATELCREAERLARCWGFDELLLQVLESNDAAISLYTSLGYSVVGAPVGGERPRPAFLRPGVTWVTCTNLCLRKQLQPAAERECQVADWAG